MINLTGLHVSFTALVGSRNYNTAIEGSDKDFKQFVYPSFKHLYSGSTISKSKSLDTIDLEVHDIRKLPSLLSKSNVNFIEVLFSQDSHSTDNLYIELLGVKEEIARMNLPHLFNACMGMFNKHIKQYHKCLVDFNLKKAFKHASEAIRISSFVKYYADSNFHSFGECIWLEEGTLLYDKVMSTKRGEVSRYYIQQSLKKGEQEALEVRNMYMLRSFDVNIDTFIKSIVKHYVKKFIKEELY